MECQTIREQQRENAVAAKQRCKCFGRMIEVTRSYCPTPSRKCPSREARVALRSCPWQSVRCVQTCLEKAYNAGWGGQLRRNRDKRWEAAKVQVKRSLKREIQSLHKWTIAHPRRQSGLEDRFKREIQPLYMWAVAHPRRHSGQKGSLKREKKKK